MTTWPGIITDDSPRSQQLFMPPARATVPAPACLIELACDADGEAVMRAPSRAYQWITHDPATGRIEVLS